MVFNLIFKLISNQLFQFAYLAGGKFIEIGAQFLHGTTGNPAYEILSSLNEVSTADSKSFP